ncbi:2-oxoglutarate dehydrogenase E2 component (dihydrolipoamide succinyltransferase) [Tranquillimonas rosea]|uniref:2-oxoglutarate dehydrogenase E2 component (Dihydrolipoamide succinyltransferase) n=1 Tax=Tranquillimonas rosea TaxID=641238 RepID=A0A1H9WAX2_9RHOB|nr:biotin/lipoyl-containing protein [Tranquillimonas rosea]SER59293.1 2-oxoglutarate dehydrogenase E2 component (dihydrolipoamide succinyltransferase) [Tranquillimonas rosea]SES30931.1 2-oxoglutarate dehydrogenase E2 component (dihydrolipoamide succinyltransferase) [Tranquillimonas rosea]
MPHEVIMPALGMAQDTGQIVAWLKAEGDAVKAGDPIMEVETDKATMEVEAAHDGFLVGLRAAAGDNVPVGQVVATIAETADAPVPDAPAGDAAKDTGDAAGTADDTAAADDGAAAPEAAPEGAPVIMPALGMAQDSGTIVAWLKAPGDAVAAGDPLLEVETDKATMEIEAGHDGYVAELVGEAGEAIPVGEVIARITPEAPAAPRHRARGATPAPDTASGTAPAPEAAADAPAPEPAVDATTDAPAPEPGGRILASPKARRLAAERGLDLARLAEAGHPQPYHAADIETLAALPDTAAGTAPGAAAGPAAAPALRLTARVPAAAFDGFRARVAERLGAPPPADAFLALAAAGALRDIAGDTGAIAVDTEAGPLTDPDLTGLGALDTGGTAAPGLAVRDLSATRLASLDTGAGPTPRLTLTRRDDTLEIALAAAPGAIAEDDAIALLAGTAERIEDPLRQLL